MYVKKSFLFFASNTCSFVFSILYPLNTVSGKATPVTKKGQETLKKLVNYLLYRLDVLLDLDWEYSKDMFGQVLPEMGETFYSYPEGANWQNRDELIQAIQNLRDYLDGQSNHT